MQKHSEQYDCYMRSAEWAQKRNERIAIDGGCIMCGRPVDKMRKIDVHHISYARLGEENVLTDICVLCSNCHRHLHAYFNHLRSMQDKEAVGG